MKLIIASDIHGNVYYTEKLLSLVDKEKPDKLILLGDLLSSYHMDDNYDPYTVANLLNIYSDMIISVEGNCDREETNSLLCFNNNHKYLELDIDGITFSLTHGHLINELPFINEDTYLLSGHTHISYLSDKHFNPGSIGLPRSGTNHSCLLYNNKTFYLINLDNNKIIEEKKLM